MKSISNQAGLYRTDNSYYYRKKIPHDLREIIGVRECKKALKNGNYVAAKQTTAFLNSSLDRLFDMIRVMQPTSDDIKFLIRNYFERLLMDAEGQLWLDSEVWRGWEKEGHDGATPDERIEQLQYGLTFVKEIAKQQGHHERFLELAKELMAWKGFTFNEMSPACTQLYSRLEDLLSRASIDLVTRTLQRYQGQAIIGINDPVFSQRPLTERETITFGQLCLMYEDNARNKGLKLRSMTALRAEIDLLKNFISPEADIKTVTRRPKEGHSGIRRWVSQAYGVSLVHKKRHYCTPYARAYCA